MSTRRANLQLGESWVVEGEEDEIDLDSLSDDEPSHITSSPAESRASRSGREQRNPTREELSNFRGYRNDDDLPPTQSPTASLHEEIQASRTKKTDKDSPEPQFIMPSPDEDTLDGSWLDPKREPRAQTSPQRKQKNDLEPTPRRRIARVSTSSENSRQRQPTGKTRSQISSSSRTDLEGPSVANLALHHTVAMSSGILDVLAAALRILKTPLSFLLAVWLLFGIGIFLRNLITSSIYTSLSPICRIPGAAFLNLPFCPDGARWTGADEASVEFDSLMNVQGKFEEVLDESSTGVGLPMDMKRGESSIRDLRQLVRYSNLRSKNELVLEFDGFIETARIASYDLQRFNSHIGRAVDNVLSTTKWTSKVLEGISEREAAASLVARAADVILRPFQPVQFGESALLDQYIQHTNIIEGEIKKLIDEAQALLMVLTNLEGRLDVIHDISARDGMHALKQRDEILSELWTLVGGNKNKLKSSSRQLDLLHQLNIYRRTAFNHVSTTIVKLQGIAAGIEDLRDRVGAPELMRGVVKVPLSVHIENIQRGVERLETQRDSSKQIENEVIRKALERGGQKGEGLMIGV